MTRELEGWDTLLCITYADLNPTPNHKLYTAMYYQLQATSTKIIKRTHCIVFITLQN